MPLFVEEVMRLLLGGGTHGGSQAIPPTLQQSLTARLYRLGTRARAATRRHITRVHFTDFVLSIELASVRSSTKRMATGRPATAPAMPVLKCSGVQRLSAASTASW